METKEEDVVESVYIASTHAYLLFFTTDGKVHWLKVHEIPEAKRDARGKAIVNLLHLAEGERVAATCVVRDFTAGGYVFFATRQGRVKKTELAAFSRPQRGGIRAIRLDPGDEVMAVRLTDGRREVLLATRQGMAIRFSEEEVRPLGRDTAGVRGLELEPEDAVIAAEVVQEGAAILTVTERGFGKQTPLDEYRHQGRGGKGTIDIKTGGRNGLVVGLTQVRAGDDILLVTMKGKLIRFPAQDVSSQGRNTWGVRVIDVDADDRVVSLARVEAERGNGA
jgi:DNA gyrase subunit A